LKKTSYEVEVEEVDIFFTFCISLKSGVEGITNQINIKVMVVLKSSQYPNHIIMNICYLFLSSRNFHGKMDGLKKRQSKLVLLILSNLSFLIYVAS